MEDYEPLVFDMYYQIKRQLEIMNYNLMDQLTANTLSILMLFRKRVP